MKAGRLRHYVELQRYQETTDDFGEPIKGYEHLMFTFAEVRPLLSRENWHGDMVNSEQTHKIMMRYRDGVEGTQRILFKNRIFELVGSPLNYLEKDIFYVFNVKEIFEHDVPHPVT